jgi:Flp pilus assembly protein TadG
MDICKPLRSADRGSLSVELALFAPVIALLILLGLFADRAATVQIDVQTAAHAAARAASIERTTGEAENAARATAEAMRPDRCATFTAAVDTGGLEPGGTATATVTLTCTTRAVESFGSTTVTATASSPIDQWRSGGETP